MVEAEKREFGLSWSVHSGRNLPARGRQTGEEKTRLQPPIATLGTAIVNPEGCTASKPARFPYTFESFGATYPPLLPPHAFPVSHLFPVSWIPTDGNTHPFCNPTALKASRSSPTTPRPGSYQRTRHKTRSRSPNSPTQKV